MGTSRCVTMQVPCRCTNSMGSSIVITWPERPWFMRSTMQASVVDLPAPAGPVTSTSPFCRSAVRSTSSGMPNSAGSGRPKGMTRTTAASDPRWRNTFARKRPTPGRANEKSRSWLPCSSTQSARLPAAARIARTAASVSAGMRGSPPRRTCRPPVRYVTGRPATKNTSDARSSTISPRKLTRSMLSPVTRGPSTGRRPCPRPRAWSPSTTPRSRFRLPPRREGRPGSGRSRTRCAC